MGTKQQYICSGLKVRCEHCSVISSSCIFISLPKYTKVQIQQRFNSTQLIQFDSIQHGSAKLLFSSCSEAAYCFQTHKGF